MLLLILVELLVSNDPAKSHVHTLRTFIAMEAVCNVHHIVKNVNPRIPSDCFVCNVLLLLLLLLMLFSCSNQ